MSDYPPGPTPPPGVPGAEEPVDALGRPLARWTERVAAFVVDELFVYIVAKLAVFALGLHHTFGARLLWFVIAVAYYGVLNGSAAGQTFGKRVFGIAVRDSDVGDSIAPAGAALRYIVVGMYRIVLFFAVFTILDGLWPLWDKRRQALHDKIAGSVVIRVSRS
jgi:uncharacterized RDD family membrane protein YckC